MAIGVIFVLLMAVCGWWLYSRWSELRDAQARRREAEMLFIFEARGQRKPAEAVATARAAREFDPTLPGDR